MTADEAVAAARTAYSLGGKTAVIAPDDLHDALVAGDIDEAATDLFGDPGSEPAYLLEDAE